jgi:uncharacterized protein (TIGR00369 family)
MVAGVKRSFSKMDETRTRTYHWDDPLAAAKTAMTMSGMEVFQAMSEGKLPPPPIARTLDMTIDEFEVGRVVFSFVPQEFHYNPIGMVHGGVIATITDSAMGCAVHTTLPAGVAYTSLEIKVNFVKAVTHGLGRLRCEGKVIQVGNRTAIAEARLTDDNGKLYAHATTTCLIMR